MLEKMQELIADVEIPTDDLESINTVGDVINFLKSKGVE